MFFTIHRIYTIDWIPSQNIYKKQEIHFVGRVYVVGPFSSKLYLNDFSCREQRSVKLVNPLSPWIVFTISRGKKGKEPFSRLKKCKKYVPYVVVKAENVTPGRCCDYGHRRGAIRKLE